MECHHLAHPCSIFAAVFEKLLIYIIMATPRLNTLKKMNTFEIISNIVELTHEKKVVSVKDEAEKFITELARRFKISTMEALFLSVFVDQSNNKRINIDNIAKHFDCRPARILSQMDVIESLVRKGVIASSRNSEGDVAYRVPQESLEAIRRSEFPEVTSLANLTIDKWIETVDEWLEKRKEKEMCDEELELSLDMLINENLHLNIAQRLKSLQMKYTDLLLFLAISLLFINNHDDYIRRCDISGYFKRSDLRSHVGYLECGIHILMKTKLLEHSCMNGQVVTDCWRLTNYSKYELFAELNLKSTVNVQSSLTHYDTIQPKELFYTPNVTRQVDQLHSLLEQEKMERVMQRLTDKGMRKGFACIFYGSPGTGKTETVMQLARLTKRDIMLVDIPSIRSCWVGDTEKNIKEVFNRYHMAVESAAEAKTTQPILLFNEADAILCKRNENGTRSVDKMENAMQNIILQEMENLEGIMIATTNLTGNLDAAFERRFLFKIEFEKPKASERQHIWKAMLPDLDDADALMLAERFDFSGGQIENIARKRIIGDVLEERETIDMGSIIESCQHELLAKKDGRLAIGFTH